MKNVSVIFIMSILLSSSLMAANISSHHTGPEDGKLYFADDNRPATLRILAEDIHTNGYYSAMESIFPPGYKGPGLHYHEQIIQAMYVRSGSFMVELIKGEEKWSVSMQPGSFLSIAPGTSHTFWNHTDDDAICLIIDAPGDLVGMFKNMAIIGRDTTLSDDEKAVQLNKTRWEKFDNHKYQP